MKSRKAFCKEHSKSYFNFDNCWLNTEGFIDKLKLGGTLFVFTGRLDYILAIKLKALKGKLKKWS
ncbi:hypothetical protein H5410_055764 [Solanum commersonii]|uniref:Uncharacterized protein n=1 Tax=Solanum commersonii TaxID=4109 RepID=A0A9J5WL68_SOLCO|nr:hypothetical protein H5410_055764 [Solanum commersonii]